MILVFQILGGIGDVDLSSSHGGGGLGYAQLLFHSPIPR